MAQRLLGVYWTPVARPIDVYETRLPGFFSHASDGRWWHFGHRLLDVHWTRPPGFLQVFHGINNVRRPLDACARLLDVPRITRIIPREKWVCAEKRRRAGC